MKCSKAQDLFSAYLEGSIAAPLRVALEQHLADCSACSGAYDRFHATVVLLDEAPEVEPPPSLHEVIMAGVNRARRVAPQPVRWWQIDWQSVFEAKVSARAVALGVAVVLALALVVQYTELGTVVGNIIGLGRQSTRTIIGEPVDAVKNPPPWSPHQHSEAVYAAPGRLSVGLKVDATSPDRIIYLLRLETDSPEPVAMDIYILPGGGYAGTNSGTKISSLAIGREHVHIVPVVVTRSVGSERALVTRIVWKHDNRIHSELVFLPPRFDAKASGKTSSIGFQGTTAHDILNAISARYGVVILAPANLAQQTVTAAIEHGTPDTALDQTIGRAGLVWRGLAPSIYLVEPPR